jgi:predicted ATP-binding protein involved in virulence
MRIKKLELKNFRGFEELTIDFPEGESGLAVFVGVNGSGKSSVLEAVAFMLQEFVADLFGISSNHPIAITTLDINQNSIYTNLEIEAEKIDITAIHSEQKWSYKKDYSSVLKSKFLKNASEGVQRFVSNNEQINLPILAYYRTHRIVEDQDSSIINLMAPQLEAYIDAFDAKINFKGFINWFIDQANIENQLKIDEKDFEVTNPKLDTVRKAMNNFLQNFPSSNFSNIHLGVSKFSVKHSKKQTLLLNKGNNIFELSQLSEGERIILLIVFDIAYRLAVANPSKNPLDGNGIILIDEIDLHLHPGWQRAVVMGLRNTFPNIQFIVTTHSPQVISTLKKENVFILNDFKLVKDTPHTFGRDSNSILWDIFNVPERPEEAAKIFSKLYRTMDDPDKVKETAELLRDAEERFGYYDSEVVRARSHFHTLNEA